MKLSNAIAVVTGAAGGIGRATASMLVSRGAKVVLVDNRDDVNAIADSLCELRDDEVAVARVGSVTDETFIRNTYDYAEGYFGQPANVCVPCAGITRDDLAVRIDKTTGCAKVYPVTKFREVLDVNLTAPTYWAAHMVAGIAEDRTARGLKAWSPTEGMNGAVVFIGSVSSQGNKGQVAYAATKAGLEGVAATLQSEWMYHGVRCSVIHPGYTNTPMVQSMGRELIDQFVIPHTQLKRLIEPEEIADAICFMISNAAVSGSLWADAGWHPAA